MDAVERRIATLWPELTERQRRLLLGAEARELGWGGVSVVARVAGVARSTVTLAVAELDQPAVLAEGRSRSDWKDVDMTADDPIAALQGRLPRHWHLLDGLRGVVRGDERWRWFEVGCSLGAGEGDELSDADVAIGYVDMTDVDELEAAARSVAASIGPPIDMIVHRMDGWPEDVCRVAAEHDDGVQLDLVMMPAPQRHGLPDRTIAIVDKDGQLVNPYVSRSSQPPSPEVAREWVFLFLGWWALSAADKYVARRSWFEATEALAEARKLALRLFATGRGVPYPLYGLVSLLDFPPFEVPDGLADTYCTPSHPPGVVAALRAARISCAARPRAPHVDSARTWTRRWPRSRPIDSPSAEDVAE